MHFTRVLQLVSTWVCAKVPVNLAQGCGALRCEIRTASGRTAFAILGGQPDVLKNLKLVEHALRMTLVSDSQSLQVSVAIISVHSLSRVCLHRVSYKCG